VKSDHQFIFTDLPELDITREEHVFEYITFNKPDVLINCAAYTAVDKAETESETPIAWKINRNAVRFIAQACAKSNVFLIHISTDYVFDGNKCSPYTESDSCGATSVYGSSKFGGELEVISGTQKAMIIRTSWLYSSFGNNFVSTMLRLGKEREELNIVADQVGCPTYARDLAYAILAIIPSCINKKEVEVYHYANSGVASWFDFAKAIFEMSNISCIVHPISSSEYPTLTKRPFYSVLNTNKIRKDYNIIIPYWRKSLQECLELMK
jgi:dTDP-4-dehydrorhamnose reductase